MTNHVYDEKIDKCEDDIDTSKSISQDKPDLIKVFKSTEFDLKK